MRSKGFQEIYFATRQSNQPVKSKSTRLLRFRLCFTIVSLGQCFRTIHNIDDGCREYTQPRAHDDSEPVGWIRGFTKIGPVIQVRATNYSDQYGIEIQVKSMLNNGSLSRIVISRGPNRYVDEVYEEIEERSHDEEMVSGASSEESITTKQHEQSTFLPSTSLERIFRRR